METKTTYENGNFDLGGPLSKAELPFKLGKKRVESITLDMISVRPEFLARSEHQQDKVQELANLIKDGLEPSPITLVGADQEKILADGLLRYEAHKLAGKEKIEAIIFEGSERDVFLLSVYKNANHGLRLNHKDKRRSAIKLLTDPEWSLWSSNVIAKFLGVSHTFINNVRKELESTSNGFKTTSRISGDGLIRNIENIGHWKNATVPSGNETKNKHTLSKSLTENATNYTIDQVPSNQDVTEPRIDQPENTFEEYETIEEMEYKEEEGPEETLLTMKMYLEAKNREIADLKSQLKQKNEIIKELEDENRRLREQNA